MQAKQVLITGVCGVLGGALYRHLSEQPERYALTGLDVELHPRDDLSPQWTPHIPSGHLLVGDIADLDTVTQAAHGTDVVVHMAAIANPAAPWEEILRNNIIGTRNILEASRQAGVKRVILASSVRVSFGYLLIEPYKSIFEERCTDAPDCITPVTCDMPTWPVDDYGAGKILGEALGRSYATQYYLSVFCLRIGGIAPNGQAWTDRAMDTSIWCSLRDFCHLVQRCVDAPVARGQFETFYAVSDNRLRWVDIDHARRIVGYVPQDGLE
jgi:nucleoside-diphosphate-sugar epimerase